MINPTVIAELNKQIQHEQSNAHIYEGVALYFEGLNLRGLAAWFYKQAGEERGHGAKLIHHMVERNTPVTLGSLPAPRVTFENPLAAVQSVLDLEEGTTKLINKLYELARTEKDYPLEILLQWYINEQVEEEAWATELRDETATLQGNPAHLYQLDHKWAKRVNAG
ncbi:MAG: ferritin [Capsulimonadaceae bacterium]|nr:ferritin [Capsulimonadaceae bacterium]